MTYDGIEDKGAIVTGSGRGTGEIHAKGLAEQGAKGAVAEIQLEAGLFLPSDAADAAAWITGQVVNVDGGQIRRP
jgi:NAD(P)-dependent dehydrogenase (short-subunit alcohol dehydrogenase family)